MRRLCDTLAAAPGMFAHALVIKQYMLAVMFVRVPGQSHGRHCTIKINRDRQQAKRSSDIAHAHTISINLLAQVRGLAIGDSS